jgi:hypothetical protein
MQRNRNWALDWYTLPCLIQYANKIDFKDFDCFYLRGKNAVDLVEEEGHDE